MADGRSARRRRRAAGRVGPLRDDVPDHPAVGEPRRRRRERRDEPVGAVAPDAGRDGVRRDVDAVGPAARLDQRQLAARADCEAQALAAHRLPLLDEQAQGAPLARGQPGRRQRAAHADVQLEARAGLAERGAGDVERRRHVSRVGMRDRRRQGCVQPGRHGGQRASRCGGGCEEAQSVTGGSYSPRHASAAGTKIGALCGHRPRHRLAVRRAGPVRSPCTERGAVSRRRPGYSDRPFGVCEVRGAPAGGGHRLGASFSGSDHQLPPDGRSGRAPRAVSRHLRHSRPVRRGRPAAPT